MKNLKLYTLLALLLMVGGMKMQAQEFQRKSSLQDPLFLDTTSVVFHEIYDLWLQYEYAQFLMGMDKVADVFFAAKSRQKLNYFPQIDNFSPWYSTVMFHIRIQTIYD